MWPGTEGGALLLSALLRQPLACAWMQHIPAVCGFQVRPRRNAARPASQAAPSDHTHPLPYTYARPRSRFFAAENLPNIFLTRTHC